MVISNWKLRQKSGTFNPYVKYKNEPNLFSLKINHGGHFTYYPGPKRTRAPRRVYKGGDADWFDDVDADGFSVIEVSGMLKELGYLNPKMKVYFKRPTHDLDKGLEPLFKDVDVLDMMTYVHKFKLMEVFVEHPIDSTVIENVDLDNANIGLDTQEVVDLENDNVDENVGLGNDNVEENVDLGQSSEPRPSPNGDEFDPLFSYPATNNDMRQSSEPNSPNETSQVREDSEGSDRSVSNDDSEGSDRSVSNDDSEEDSEDSDFECDLEDQINDVDVDMELFRKNTDPSVEWVGSAEVDPNEVEADGDMEYEECDIDDFDSEIDSDDEEAERKKALRKLGKCHRPVDGKFYTENFYVSQTFANKELIKEMVTRIAVEQRRQIYLTKNDKERVRAECRGIVPIFSNSGPNVGGLSEGQSQGPSINPCAGPDMWPPSDSPIILTPPDYHTPIGRPPKKRKKSAAELYDNMVKGGKLSRAGKTVTCKKCKQKGHNSRSCTGRPSQSQSSQRPSKATKTPCAPSQSSHRPSKAKKNPSAPSQPTPVAPSHSAPVAPTQSVPVAPRQSTPSQVTPNAPLQSFSASRLSPLKGSNSNVRFSKPIRPYPFAGPSGKGKRKLVD
ncbi:transposase, MuDR [Artemisia annua]|uniref:Transposase, MuDR n=1 Tax=Artemisia annua TaxID=35608 RepID=A0A2U1NED4_ARTAN|nr:transposase, MuDR [Artemisia annua]